MGEGWGLDGDGTYALDNYQTFAEESLTLRGGKTLHGGLASIVCTEDAAIALTDEDHLILGPRTEIAVLINHFSHDKGSILSFIVGSETDVMRGASSLDGLFANRLTILT